MTAHQQPIQSFGSLCVHGRWNYNMTTDHFNDSHWRKSSQWFVLTRAHAILAVEDQHLKEIFRRFCYFMPPNGRVCIGDEHYFASLLASYGLDNQTYCKVYDLQGQQPQSLHAPSCWSAYAMLVYQTSSLASSLLVKVQTT